MLAFTMAGKAPDVPALQLNNNNTEAKESTFPCGGENASVQHLE